MAEAAVEYLLENLKQLLLYHGSLIANSRDQIVKLEEDLRLFKAFLKETTKKRRTDEMLSELVRQIRDVVYDAEDIIDTFVTKAIEVKSKNYFERWYKKTVTLHSIGKAVEGLLTRIQVINERKIDFALINVADRGPDEETEAPFLRQENIVGFEDAADELMGYLREEKQEVDVISIIGMPGLGKTTLAGMIFRDPKIQFEFHTRIWVYISQEYKRKNVLLTILKQVTTVTDEMGDKTDQELADIVEKHLTEKFLIVLDDLWTAEDWSDLKNALPMRNKKGKIVITSRHMEVGNSANPNRAPHQLRFLNSVESWLLLRLEVFGKQEFPQELEVYGKRILEKCDGLPLAIVVIGGILGKKVSPTGDVAQIRTTWETVSENVSTHIVSEDSYNRMEKIITLSYDNLPYHLRACFLYLGMFPEDFEIPAWRLTLMWIAEGFIQQKGDMSLEESAESYLGDLINRNLLRVDTRRRDGKVKTCRIHDVIRDFCRNEAGKEKENFLQEIKIPRIGPFERPDIVKFRRLCMYSNVAPFFSTKPYGPGVRSFLYFSQKEINLPPESNSAIPAAFKLVRVLEVLPIKFIQIPKGMYQLVHLRYIAIQLNSNVLPKEFSKLWNIQTLIVNTTHRAIEIKADIWMMKRLRHLKTNASATLPIITKEHRVEAGEHIKTLGTISTKSCTEEVFGRARYVKKLGIRGPLNMIFEAGQFESMSKLCNLENLKLINEAFPQPASKYPLSGLPPAYQFPPKLRKLNLADTFLDWSKMSVLGLLENLEVLKLKDQAFMGETWVAGDGGFRKLEVLYIGRTNLVTWVACKHHFPRLHSLELWNCKNLLQVPEDLAEIETFQFLTLNHSIHAAANAGKFRKKQEQGHISKFKLLILPPEDLVV